ncbi:MAG: hypothetical protein ABI557_12285, partial [Aureliella sp.]
MQLRDSYWHRFPKLLGLVGTIAIGGCQSKVSKSLNAPPQAVATADAGKQVADAGKQVADVGNQVAEASSTSVAPESRPDVAPPVVSPESVDADGLVVLGSENRLPVEANVATAAERNQKLALDWPKPQAVLFVSGQQHGYIEPCGCTGLENQKGGLIRRDTLLNELRERGWDIIPVDVGNQVRRIGRQPELKFQSTVEAFRTMGYRAAALGIDDLKLSTIDLIQMAGSDGHIESPFLSANITVYGE